MVDRLSPTMRPDFRNAGTQTWKDLLFEHWEIPADDLRTIVPAELEIDTFEGQAFVGVVPFKMRNIRPNWLPKSFGMNFLETNVRTYVIHKGRPGVYFFSLDANSKLAVWAARSGWSLPYFYSQMSSLDPSPTNDKTYSYSSSRKSGDAAHQVQFRIQNELGASKPDSLEHFLFERYLLFVKKSDSIYAGQVHHEPYQPFSAELIECKDSMVAASGLTAPNRAPDLLHYSPGVDVEVFAIKKVSA